MPDYTNDARFKELQFLAGFEHKNTRWQKVRYPKDGGTFEDAKRKQMVLSLIFREMLNGPDILAEGTTGVTGAVLASELDRQFRGDRADLINALVSGREVELELGHLGRLRLFELQDQLKATRIREAFGILFDGRHAERDVAVAILNSRPESPLSLAYLDMNGLKAFNEDGDHSTGDAAIKAFFHVVEKAVSGVGDAYRKGGDEVMVIMPGTPLVEARRCMSGALMSLSKEEISVNGVRRKLSSACGLLAVVDPHAVAEAEIQGADRLQKEAKAASKNPERSRCSALKVQGEPVERFGL
ncbi:GGDEF domain-containing protein [Hyalangium versicolor]|uniref:GGDEF domain-containing protein n=1 Tax=Hyalangium versicolor TaxID=2861190 RepID=UPI001CCB5AFC|nr:GGDEF domain-containing protein [Hyalangium versicolor]